MKLFNSFTNKIEEFKPIEENKVKMYVCGPTVYDYAHLGHARCYITWDVLYRYLKFKGYDVTYCRNVTDVDDKILKKAEKEGKTPEEVSTCWYKAFAESMKKLNTLKPDIEPFATKTLGEMISIIKDLINKGFAYEVNGDVYFRVKKFPQYGMLSKQPIDQLESCARVEVGEVKEYALDFALWKKDEKFGYKSPWGVGRPGWHIECSAMSRKYLGKTIDIHAGGADLIFPHHENEIAQSECANGCKFVNYWLHNGFVTINKEKMSKSLGNFLTIDDLLKLFHKIVAAEELKADEEALYMIATAADGSARDGLSLLDQAISLGAGKVRIDVVKEMLGLADRGQTFELFNLITNGNMQTLLLKLKEMYQNGANPTVIINDLINITHNLTKTLLLPSFVEDPSLSENEKTFLKETSAKMNVALLSRLWQMLIKGMSEIQTAPVPIDALEMVLVRVAYSANLPSPAELLESIKKEA